MSAYRVAIVADDASPTGTTAGLGGSSAVIRIDGLREWPPNATLRILPIDDTAVPPKSDGWPWGDLIPLRVLSTETGLDVVLGPDVVGSARLTPGTPITIQVPAAQLEVEARWPSVAPTIRRRANAVAMSAGQMLAAKAERDQAQRLTTARRQELAEFAARRIREDTASDQAEAASAPAAAPPTARAETGQLARLLPVRRSSAVALPSTGPAGAGPFKAAPVPAQKMGAAPVPLPRPVVPRRNASRVGAFVAGLATMAAATAATVAVGPTSWTPPAISGTTGVATDTNQIGLADLQALFKEFATTGSQSPNNKAATSVDVATALSLADHSLRGERTPAETEEAVFWLKRALAASFSGADVGWALTQLGTIYATPGTPQHNYVKAHSIWQLAAAQGDPVAHCFLGALYEHGLGIARNRKTALDHYKSAQVLGACRGAEDAVARLSQ